MVEPPPSSGSGSQSSGGDNTQNEKAELFQPDSIANFLKYCQKVAPAKNYILVLSDHGGGYTVYEDYDKSLQAKTRGVVMDDNLEMQSISCKELRAGIEQSGNEEGSFHLSYSVSVGGKGFIGASRTKDAPNIIKGYTKDGKYAELNMETLKLEAKGVAANHLTWANTYNRLKFDIATGWSTWLEKNPGFPINNPPYDNKNDMLPTGMPQSAADWDIAIKAYYETDFPTFKNFKIKNTFYILGRQMVNPPVFPKTFTWQQFALPAPVKGQFIVEVTPKEGKTGPWELNVSEIIYSALICYKGKYQPVKAFKLDGVKLSGTSIETEGDEAAKKAYINLDIDIDKDGNVKFTQHKQDENFILK